MSASYQALIVNIEAYWTRDSNRARIILVCSVIDNHFINSPFTLNYLCFLISVGTIFG